MDIEADILLVQADAREARRTIDLLWSFEAGARTYWCRDGIEALEFVFGTGRHWNRPEGYPRLVLLDAEPLLLDGLEVLRRIRSSRAADGLIVVVLASAEQPGDRRRTPGIDGWIVKPLGAAAIERALLDAGLETAPSEVAK